MGSPFAMKHRRNPVSIALHSSLAPCEMPSVSSLRDKASKIGILKKLSGKGILTSGTWRDRFCLLVKSKLYYYDSEDSTGAEKSCGFVNLEYFDTCTEASTRMARKATNVFVIGASDKGFFESHSGRHYFAAETLPEMKDWVNAINTAMKNHIRSKEKRTIRDGSLTPGQTKRDSSKMKCKEDESPTETTLPRSGVRLDHVTKDRVRGPQGRRLPRKPQKSSGAEISHEGGIDSLVGSDEDCNVRDSRGRATSLSALEISSETHPKVSLEKGEHQSRSQTRPENNNHKFEMPWGSPRTGEHDGVDTPDIDLIYNYSSSEDSDEDFNKTLQTARKESGRKSSMKSSGSGASFQKRPQSRSGSRGAILRNSSVTPPPCVLRKYRRDQINVTGSNGNTPLANETKQLHFNGKNKGREESPSPLLPEFDIKPQRTSSGSSLSTLTADTYSQISLVGPFSSLQRNNNASRRVNGNGPNPTQSNRNSGFFYNRPSASANASPLMNGTHNGHNGNGCYHRNGYNSQNNSPNSTFDRNSVNFGNGKGFQIEKNLYSVTKELESIQQETKQLDVEVTGLRQDVGIVQENIVTVRSAVDNTRDRVNKLQNQVSKIEHQVTSIIQEAKEMKDQAKEFLRSAQHAKEVQETLLEEAQNLVGFLRQSASFVPTSPYLHQHNFGHFQPNFCSQSPIPPAYYGQQPSHQMPTTQTLRRNGNGSCKSKESKIDTDEADMETINESLLIQNNNQQNGYFDSLGVKNRKSKSIHSNGSSGSSSGSVNRVSVLEPLERKIGSKSPNSEGKVNDGSLKISHL